MGVYFFGPARYSEILVINQAWNSYFEEKTSELYIFICRHRYNKQHIEFVSSGPVLRHDFTNRVNIGRATRGSLALPVASGSILGSSLGHSVLFVDTLSCRRCCKSLYEMSQVKIVLPDCKTYSSSAESTKVCTLFSVLYGVSCLRLNCLQQVIILNDTSQHCKNKPHTRDPAYHNVWPQLP